MEDIIIETVSSLNRFGPDQADYHIGPQPLTVPQAEA